MDVLDGPLEQTECLEDENSDFDQIKPLGYLGRKFGRFDLDGPLDRTECLEFENSDNLDAKTDDSDVVFSTFRTFFNVSRTLTTFRRR